MGVARHKNVLSALEKRALRHRRKGEDKVDCDNVLYNEAIDWTGTVSTASLTDSDSDSVGADGEFASAMATVWEND